jgi:peptidoglycan/LPS O-acetylase OafA/YrhL
MSRGREPAAAEKLPAGAPRWFADVWALTRLSPPRSFTAFLRKNFESVCTPPGRPSSAHRISYRPDIDGLRGLAVTCVVLAHAFPHLMPNGFVGVDIFFVVSGFVITSIIVAQLRAGSFSLTEFYIRRINRIFPALILVLVACIGFGWLSLYADEFKSLGRSVAWGSGFLANINLFLEVGYWDVSAKLKPLLHLWSLGVEEQFYLAWPLIIFAIWVFRFNTIACLLVLISVSLYWSLHVIVSDQAAAFYLPFSRLWELLCGAALACAGMRKAPHDARSLPAFDALVHRLQKTCRDLNPKFFYEGFTLLGLTLIVIALAADIDPREYPGAHAVIPVFGTFLIIAAGSKTWINSKILAHNWLVYVGLISFPLYMWHWPMLTFARILENGELSAHSRNWALGLAVILAASTYHFCEKPIRTNTRRRGLTAAVLAALVVACGAAGYSIYLRDGLESRYAAPDSFHAGSSLLAVGHESKVALIGDSSAGQLVPALSSIYGSDLVVFATGAWPYLVGTDYKAVGRHSSWTATPAITEQALTRILSDPMMDVVIVAHMYVGYVDEDTLRSGPVSIPGETSAMAYESGLRRTIERLTGAGKKVIYVKSVPFLGNVGASVLTCSSKPLLIPRTRADGCVTPLTQVQKSRVIYDGIVSRATRDLPLTFVFDPLPYLCDQSHCYVERDGVMFYKDRSHLSDDGGKLLSGPLARFVEAHRTTAEARSR